MQADFLSQLPAASTCDASLPAAFYGVGNHRAVNAWLQPFATGASCNSGEVALSYAHGSGPGVNGTAAHPCLAFMPCVNPASTATCTTADGVDVSQATVASCFCRGRLEELARDSVWSVVFPTETAGDTCDSMFHSYLFAQLARLVAALIVSVVTTLFPSVVAGELIASRLHHRQPWHRITD